MNLRKFSFAAAVTFGLFSTCDAAQAQQTGRVYRVGALFNGSPNRGAPGSVQGQVEFDALKAELARRGYVEGTNVIFEARFADGQMDRFPGLAAELVALGVDVIASYGGPPTNAARKATRTIPIVAALVADPVALGFAATLDRPGGNVTGITNH
ncbi:MAG: hypothetical protein M3Q89_12055, partial [Verrucomicrobiota bacterium]|nr:hypothetical protein [Verrucomicrobiota bacterium]